MRQGDTTMDNLDQILLRHANEQIAPNYDNADFLCAETRARLLERLGYMAIEPRVILDLGGSTGATTKQLATLFPDATIINLDWSEAMLAAGNNINNGHTAKLCADSQSLPLIDASVDIVVSNMMLPGCPAPERVFSETCRVLRTPGLFLFNTLGPDTLKELKRAWTKIDTAPHVHTFADMHNVGDALVHAGFREPVMDNEAIRVNYRDVDRLVEDLRAVAAMSLHPERRRGLTSPRLWRRLVDAAHALRDPNGKFPISIELITGQAWKGLPGPGVGMDDGVASFPLSRLRSGR